MLDFWLVLLECQAGMHVCWLGLKIQFFVSESESVVSMICVLLGCSGI